MIFDLCMFPKEPIYFYRDTWSPMFMAVLVTLPWKWKLHRCPTTDEWFVKIIIMEYYVCKWSYEAHRYMDEATNANFDKANPDLEKQMLHDLSPIRMIALDVQINVLTGVPIKIRKLVRVQGRYLKTRKKSHLETYYYKSIPKYIHI